MISRARYVPFLFAPLLGLLACSVLSPVGGEGDIVAIPSTENSSELLQDSPPEHEGAVEGVTRVVGEPLLPLPPVFEIPGVSPEIVGINVENYIRPYDDIRNVSGYYTGGTVWRYTDSNDPSYSAHARRLDILFALWKSGWKDWPSTGGEMCNEIGRIHEADESQAPRAVLEIECERLDGEEIRWDTTFHFNEGLSDLLSEDEIPPWERLDWQLCAPEGCLTGVDLAKAHAVEYEITSSTADFYEGAHIPPIPLPIEHLRFKDYSAHGILYTDGGRGPEWTFTDLGGWSDEERWATIRYLMRESAFGERCEEDAEQVGGVFVSGYACYNQDGEQMLWFVNETDHAWHTISTRGSTERSRFVLLPTLSEALEGHLPLGCRLDSASSNPEEMLTDVTALLDRAGMEPSNLIESYDDLLASGVQVVTPMLSNPELEKCSLVVTVMHSQDYGSIIYEREGGGVRVEAYRMPFDERVTPREGWPKDLLDGWREHRDPWWYRSTAIETEQFAALYDPDTMQFQIRLTNVAGDSEGVIKTATGAALLQLADLGISLDRQDYHIVTGLDQ